MDWHIFFSAFGGTAAALAIVGFLSKSIIGHWLNKDLSKFNTGLNENLESFKTELNASAKKQEITFSRLHQDRAAAIKEMMNISASLERRLERYVNALFDVQANAVMIKAGILKLDEDKIEAAYNELKGKMESFRISFQENSFLFEQQIEKEVSFIIELIDDAVLNGHLVNNMDGDQEVIVSNFLKPVKKSIEALRSEFRKLLNVEDKQ